MQKLLAIFLACWSAQAAVPIHPTSVDPLAVPVLDYWIKNQTNRAVSSRRYPTNCAEATAISQKSGLYLIQVEPFIRDPFWVYCDHETLGGGWTVFQRRQDGSIDFWREWDEYKHGFGNIEREHWLGLDRLHALTNSGWLQELLVVLEDFNSTRVYAKYDSFAVGSEAEEYALKVLGAYSGNGGDALSWHQSNKFSTKDRTDNGCPVYYTGAWWYGYTSCYYSSLNGIYLPPGTADTRGGIKWRHFRGDDSLKYTAMMVRPRRS